MPQSLQLVLAVGCVLLNGFFVATEFAIVKVRSTRIEELAQEGSRRAKVARGVVGHLDAYLSATQLGITLASLGLGWLGEPAVAVVFEPLMYAAGFTSPDLIHTASLVVAFCLITLCHVVVGELAPKSIAIQKPDETTLLVAVPVRLFYQASYPVIWILNRAANSLLKLIGIEPAGEHEKAHSESELRMILSASDDLSDTEKDILDNVFVFSDRIVRQVMVPRVDMVCLYTGSSLDDTLATVRENRHTRYPLCEDDPDHVVGILHLKDLLPAIHGTAPMPGIGDLVRRPCFVPESQRVERLLRTFQRERTQIAIAIDEFGGTTGLVTLEDLIEELVGDIQDEFDQESPEIERLPQGGFRVDGGTLLDKVVDSLGLDLSDLGVADSDTVGGYVLGRLGREAAPGETIRIGEYAVRVTETKSHRITALYFVHVDNDGTG